MNEGRERKRACVYVCVCVWGGGGGVPDTLHLFWSRTSTGFPWAVDVRRILALDLMVVKSSQASLHHLANCFDFRSVNEITDNKLFTPLTTTAVLSQFSISVRR